MRLSPWRVWAAVALLLLLAWSGPPPPTPAASPLPRRLLEEPFAAGQTPEGPGAGGPRVAIAGLMRRPVDLSLWLKHHRGLGVSRFYLRLEDSPGAEEELRREPDVWTEPGRSDQSGNNYETLMDRQLAFVNRVMERAAADGIQWVFHLDADELLEGDLLGHLAGLPPSVKCITIENVEAVYSGDENSCFSSKNFLRCSKGAACRSYVNSKPAGRTEPHVRLAGPHNFSYKGEMSGAAVRAVPFDTLRVLHFDSCTFGSWMEKFAHLAKNAKKDAIPFPYYRESIDAARTAAGVYLKYRGESSNQVDYVRGAAPPA